MSGRLNWCYRCSDLEERFLILDSLKLKMLIWNILLVKSLSNEFSEKKDIPARCESLYVTRYVYMCDSNVRVWLNIWEDVYFANEY